MRLKQIILIILISVSSIFAQDIGTTKVTVIEGFQPTIPEATRLNENATFADTIRRDRTQEYKMIHVNIDSDYNARPLAAAKVKDDKIIGLYATKVGVGFGNAYTTKLSLVHNSRRSNSLSYGIIANHLANKYYLAKNSKNSIHLYAKKISSSYIFLANLDYDRRTALYYDDELGSEEEKFFRNRFSYTKLSVSAISKEKSEKQLSHYTTFFISDLNERSENQLHLSSNLSKRVNGLLFGLEVELNNYLRYNNPDSEFKNVDLKSLSFSPRTSFSRYGVDFKTSINFDFTNNDPIEFFPQISAEKELVKDVLLVYAGLRHNKQKHTIKSFSDQNPYIHSFGTNQSVLVDSLFLQELRFSDTHEAYLGMRNVLSKGESFEGSVAYGIVEDFAHFTSFAHSDYSRFIVNYVDVQQLHVSLNYSRVINNIISLNASSDYFTWDKNVYHTPNLKVKLGSPINLRDKIKVSPSISYIGERQVNSLSLQIPAQMHANLGVYYVYSKQLSAYLQLNNLANSKKDLWLGYREVGFNALFGVNYFF
tara:strand:+ start:13 stop:1623 length:1611 start_codon:yes stop_codon:yes gene_type:complete